MNPLLKRDSVCFLCAGPLESLTLDPFETGFERCLPCQLILRKRSQQLGVDDARAFYGTHQNDPRDERYRRFLSKVTEPLVARLPRAARGLDYGSGPVPALATLMKEAGFETHSYDPLFAADQALVEQTYDFVTSSEVVEHFIDPAQDWARLFARVRRGGLLAVMTEWYRGQSPLSSWRYARDPTHNIFYTQIALTKVADRFAADAEFPTENVCIFCIR